MGSLIEAEKESLSRLLQKMQNFRRSRISEDAESQKVQNPRRCRIPEGAESQKVQNFRGRRIPEGEIIWRKRLLTIWKQVLRKLGKLSQTIVSGDNIILRLSENPWNIRYEPCACFLPDTRNYPLERAEICET